MMSQRKMAAPRRRSGSASPGARARSEADTASRAHAGETAKGSAAQTAKVSQRASARSDDKHRQILAAALTVFAKQGYEGARLDEIAERAGVAKGTLYLYFPGKQAIFEALVQSAADPVLDRLAMISAGPETTAAERLSEFVSVFKREVLDTDRKLIIRLIVAEGPRFPELVAHYHRHVIARVLTQLRTMARQAHAKGELASNATARFPHLIAAPLLLAVIWDALFDHIEPLDVEGMLTAHVGLVAAHPATRR
ncbi:MAG: TetR/AcrR family transcriptional regulator [Hyphomicrobiaceae bacterium]